jgi:hypothetical protein
VSRIILYNCSVLHERSERETGANRALAGSGFSRMRDTKTKPLIEKELEDTFITWCTYAETIT